MRSAVATGLACEVPRLAFRLQIPDSRCGVPKFGHHTRGSNPAAYLKGRSAGTCASRGQANKEDSVCGFQRPRRLNRRVRTSTVTTTLWAGLDPFERNARRLSRITGRVSILPSRQPSSRSTNSSVARSRRRSRFNSRCSGSASPRSDYLREPHLSERTNGFEANCLSSSCHWSPTSRSRSGFQK